MESRARIEPVSSGLQEWAVTVSRDAGSHSFWPLKEESLSRFPKILWKHFDLKSASLRACELQPRFVLVEYSTSDGEAALEETCFPASWIEVPTLVYPRDPGIRDAATPASGIDALSRYIDGSAMRTRISDVGNADELLRRMDPEFSRLELRLNYSKNDPFITHLQNLLTAGGRSGEELLKLVLGRFVPEAKAISILVESGGWSGDTVIRVTTLGSDSKEYFIKLFFAKDQDKVLGELENEVAAEQWLGKFAAKLHLPWRESFSGSKGFGYREVFPALRDRDGRNWMAAGWESGRKGTKRKLLAEIYRESDQKEMANAYDKIIGVLGTGQIADEFCIQTQPPFELQKVKSLFERHDHIRGSILRMLSLLSRFGSGTSSWENFLGMHSFDADLKNVEHALWHAPKFLSQPVKVACGHVHWDPNSRNILLNQQDYDDLVFIDCGGYDNQGFRVFDLTALEADLKLALMGSESTKEFGHYDTAKISQWLQMEKLATVRGLSLEATEVEKYCAEYEIPEATRKAYCLIAQIRQTGLRLSGEDDQGVTYFAGLLYWSLRMITLPLVPDAKKYLAVYSVARILEKFNS